MIKHEQHVLICTRVAEMGAPQIQARVEDCDKCGAAIWRAESSPKRAVARCYACAMLFMEPDAKLGKATKRQLREIKEIEPDFDLGKTNKQIFQDMKLRRR